MRFTRDGFLTAVIVVAALFLGSRVVQLIPSADDQFGRPFEYHAAVGEAVEIRTGTVTVTGVGSAVELELYGGVTVTTAVYLVVDLEWVTTKEPAKLHISELLLEAADGRTFGGVAPVPSTCMPGQPHITLSCQAPFEVPADALEGAKLRIPAAGQSKLDDLVVVDLGIDAARAEDLADPEERIKLTGPVESA